MHVGISPSSAHRNITATSFRHCKVRAKVKVEVLGRKANIGKEQMENSLFVLLNILHAWL